MPLWLLLLLFAEVARSLLRTYSTVREPDGGGVSLATLSLCLKGNSSLLPKPHWHVSALPESEFGFEHGLSLQPGALSDEKVIVVSLEWSFVNIEHFVPQVEGHAVERMRD